MEKAGAELDRGFVANLDVEKCQRDVKLALPANAFSGSTAPQKAPADIFIDIAKGASTADPGKEKEEMMTPITENKQASDQAAGAAARGSQVLSKFRQEDCPRCLR